MNTIQTIESAAANITAFPTVHPVHPPTPQPEPRQQPVTPLADLNPEDIKTMNIHQIGDLITRLEREMSQPTENQADPTQKLVRNEREIPENPENSHPPVGRGSCRAGDKPHPVGRGSSRATQNESPDSIHPQTPQSSAATSSAGVSDHSKNFDETTDSPDSPSTHPSPSPTPRTHRHSILLALNKEDRAFVLDLLETHTLEQTKTRLAQPRPFGLGICVSVAALHRFGSNERADQIVAQQDSALSEAAVILGNAAEMDDTQFVLAAKHLLKLRLVRTAISRNSSTAELRALFQTLDRLRQTDLAERRLALAEKNRAPENRR